MFVAQRSSVARTDEARELACSVRVNQLLQVIITAQL
jgi:hypothetical protein